MKLIGVIDVNRHGARTPENFDNLTSYLFFGSTGSQLTINGYQQQELLGQWIAERYIYDDYHLLSEEYNPHEVIFKSSPAERAIFSGTAFIKGLYPNSNVQPFYENKKIRNDDVPPIKNFELRRKKPIIPLTVTDPDNDYLFHTVSCKLDSNEVKIKELLPKISLFNYTDEEIRNTIDEIKSQLEEPFIGIPPAEIYTRKFLKSLVSFIRPVQYHYINRYNFTQKATEIMNKFQIEKWYGIRMTEGKLLKLINSGFYSQFTYYFDKMINERKLKFVLFSGHDTNIIGILVNLLSLDRIIDMTKEISKFYNFLQPPYATNFLFELHSYHDNIFKRERYFIRFIYNGETLREGFREGMAYNYILDGIEYDVFKGFLMSRIEPSFRTLNCKRNIKDRDDLLLLQLNDEQMKLQAKFLS